MAMDGGSCQGALGGADGAAGDDGDARGGGEARPRRRVQDPGPGRPEDQLAQVVGAPDAAVADRRDGRHGDAHEHHGQRAPGETHARVPGAL
jgi:hypothetical protein